MPNGQTPASPFAQLEDMWKKYEMDRIFDDFFRPHISFINQFKRSSDGDYTLKVEAPGFNSSDIDISVNDEGLRVKGSCQLEGFQKTIDRVFLIPHGADTNKISAALKNGILTVSIKARTDKESKVKVKME